MPKVARDQQFSKLLAERLRGARVNANISQDALGAALNLSHQMVSKYESGRSRISVEQLAGWARVTGHNIKDLIP